MISKISTYFVKSLKAIEVPEKKSWVCFAGRLDRAIKLIRPENRPNKKAGQSQEDLLKEIGLSFFKVKEHQNHNE